MQKYPQRGKVIQKKSINKITNNTIDEIMSASFGPSPRYMNLIRQCYTHSKKVVPQRFLHWEFNSALLKEKCASAKINISEEKIEQIQVLSELTLTVSDILDGNNELIKTAIKSQAEIDIQSFSFIFNTNYGIPYWKTFFKYFSICIEYSQVLNWIILLPHCDKKFIKKWIDHVNNTPSFICIGDRRTLEGFHSFLLDYCNELLNLTHSQVGKQEDVFRLLLAKDFFYAAHYIDVIKQISKKGKRQNSPRLGRTPRECENTIESGVVPCTIR